MPEHEFVAARMHLPYTVCQPKPTEFRIHLLLYVMPVPFRIPSIHKTLSAHILHRLRDTCLQGHEHRFFCLAPFPVSYTHLDVYKRQITDIHTLLTAAGILLISGKYHEKNGILNI